MSDSDHCGICSNLCGSSQECLEGVCDVSMSPYASCRDLLLSMPMWGRPAQGVDLRPWTNSTLHYLGCCGLGCEAEDFFCTFDEDTETLRFGAVMGALRAVVDPGDAHGNDMPVRFNGCCSEPLGLCNAPDGNNNGVNFDGGQALCHALGYERGRIVRISNENTCPEVHAISDDGQLWSSDFFNSNGYGAEFECRGFIESD